MRFSVLGVMPYEAVYVHIGAYEVVLVVVMTSETVYVHV